MTFSLYGTDVLRVPRAETRMRDCERSRGMIERTNSMVIPLRPGITVLDLRLLVRYLARTLCNLTICKASSTAVLSPGQTFTPIAQTTETGFIRLTSRRSSSNPAAFNWVTSP